MKPDESNLPDTPVLIIGGGPTGLSLALGLAKLSIPSVLVEEKESTSDRSKAPGIHVRTREVFRMWGIEKQILSAGNLKERVEICSPNENRILFTANFQELEGEAYKPGIVVLEQGITEKIICAAVKESGICDLRFSTKAVGLKAATGEVQVNLKNKDGSREEITASYVVGCDGAKSFVRHELNLPFKGITYSVEAILADVKITDQRNKLPWPRFYNGKGITAALRLNEGLWRIIRLETGEPHRGKDVPESELKARVEEVLGAGDFQTMWANPFRIHRRASPLFRRNRILLAGDAAHVHSPVGGQGMNAGIQDAHNLAWKLAAALKGADPDPLLDSYEEERREVVVKKVSRYTDLITRTFLQSPLVVRKAAFFSLRRILDLPPFRRKFLRRTSMVNLGYSKSSILTSAHPTVGKRIPNVKLFTPDGQDIRLYELLSYRPVLLEIGRNRKGTIPENWQKIRIGGGQYKDKTVLLRNFLGSEEGWILLRPDAHVAWAGENTAALEFAPTGL